VGFKKQEVKGIVILKAFNSEELQNALFQLAQLWDVIDIKFSTTNLTNRQSSALVEYSAMTILGEKLEAKEATQAGVLDAAHSTQEVVPANSKPGGK
jgi:hypothetical protein